MIPVGILMMALGYFSLFISFNVVFVFFGGVLIGASYSILYAEIFLQVSVRCRYPEEQDFAISLITAGLFLGQFVSPILISAVEWIINCSGYRMRFLLLCSILMMAAAVSGVCILLKQYYMKRKGI